MRIATSGPAGVGEKRNRNREPRLSNSVEGAAIFVSIELSRARWLVTSISPNTSKFSLHSVPGSDIAELLRLLGELRAKAERRINTDVRIICIQEIGFDGFWIHRILMSSVLWQEGLYCRFANRRQLAAYAGFAPSPWQSGDVNKEQGTAKRKLLIAFWRFATFGETPEGATLKIA